MDAKRRLDLIFGYTALITFSPLFLIITMLIWGSMGRPVLFRQQRPGLNGRPFWLLKFRTMTNAKDKSGKLFPDSRRITKLGRWLRITSIDELPELWNVIKGDMSLVGPRPLLMDYLPLYNEEQARRHEIKPGLTGWAQVNGRNALSWEDKFKLDIWYVDNRSFKLDLIIMLRTLKKVFLREGISALDQATVEKFRGNIR